MLWFCSAILWQDINMYLVLTIFISRLTLLVSVKFSVFFFMNYLLDTKTEQIGIKNVCKQLFLKHSILLIYELRTPWSFCHCDSSISITWLWCNLLFQFHNLQLNFRNICKFLYALQPYIFHHTAFIIGQVTSLDAHMLSTVFLI